MKTKYFYPDKDGNIIFTISELEKLLNDVYDEGREQGRQDVQPYMINPNPVIPVPTVIYNTPQVIPTPELSPYRIYCTDDNSIGRITLECETLNNIGE